MVKKKQLRTQVKLSLEQSSNVSSYFIDTLISASKLRVLSHNPPIQQNKTIFTKK